ncbi:MAG: metallophosphatase family protein [Deinococcota bacterium]|jgi:predicted phosphodiesterase|nr:metallophosphatase family protein [Deinococcota bacterium]
MRYLVLSDIHANHVALAAVLEHAGAQAWDGLVFLGDAVGYGAQPEEVVQALMRLGPAVAICGNHELMVLKLADGHRIGGGAVAEIAARHSRELSAESLGFLRGLELEALREGWAAVHGALRKPWEYIISVPSARMNQPLMKRDLYFVGHTHVPMAYILSSKGGTQRWQPVSCLQAHTAIELQAGQQAFVNPGSVGQPRDGSVLASYAIFDEASRRIEIFRIAFDHEAARAVAQARGYGQPVLR